MKKLLVAAVALASLGFAAPAAAGVYGSIGYSEYRIDNFEIDSATVRVGWDSESWWGVEAEASFGVEDDTSGGVTVDLNSDLAVYAKATLPLSDRFEVFARAGYGTTQVDVSPAVIADDNADGFAWGVGAQFNLTENDGVRFDWTSRDVEDDFGDELTSWSLSYVRRFR